MALARRNAQERLVEPLYELQDVPRCARDLEQSVLVKVEDRNLWMRLLPELLLLCNEAALRFEKRAREVADRIRAETPPGQEPDIPAEMLPIHSGKALSLEYICDRMDLDDPLYGYVVRTAKESWIQGFITISTFTSWQRWFRWDSLGDEAGVLAFDAEGAGLDAMHSMGLHTDNASPSNPEMRWWMDRLVDGDGSLAAALNAEVRDGDPDIEGIIWPHVAELSLLGGIGCGSFLVNLIIEELEDADCPYNYVVLQATENSVPFYEKHGFVRVGAVARYFEKPGADAASNAGGAAAGSGSGPGSGSSAQGAARSAGAGARAGPGSSALSHISSRFGAAAPDSPLPGTPQSSGGRNTTRKRRNSQAPAKALVSSAIEPADPSLVDADTSPPAGAPSTPARGPRGLAAPGASSSSSGVKRCLPDQLPKLDGASSKFRWHKVETAKTPTIREIAALHGVLAVDIVFLNRRLYGAELTEDAHLVNGVMLRIPCFPEFFDPIQHCIKGDHAPPILASATRPMVTCDARPGEVSSSGLWYCARDNDTPRLISSRAGVDTNALIAANAKLYPNLTSSSALMENTLLRLPDRRARPKNLAEEDLARFKELEVSAQDWGWGSDDSNQKDLSGVMTYRHWAFSDDPVEMSVSSYMMARPLKKRPPGQKRNGPLSATTQHSKVAQLASARFVGVDTIAPAFVYGGDFEQMQSEQIKHVQPASAAAAVAPTTTTVAAKALGSPGVPSDGAGASAAADHTRKPGQQSPPGELSNVNESSMSRTSGGEAVAPTAAPMPNAGHDQLSPAPGEQDVQDSKLPGTATDTDQGAAADGELAEQTKHEGNPAACSSTAPNDEEGATVPTTKPNDGHGAESVAVPATKSEQACPGPEVASEPDTLEDKGAPATSSRARARGLTRKAKAAAKAQLAAVAKAEKQLGVAGFVGVNNKASEPEPTRLPPLPTKKKANAAGGGASPSKAIVPAERDRGPSPAGFPKRINVLVKCTSLRKLKRDDPALRMGPFLASLDIVGCRRNPKAGNANPGSEAAGVTGDGAKKRRRESSDTAQPTDLAMPQTKVRFLANTEGKHIVRVFLRGSPFVGQRLSAMLSHPLKEPDLELIKPVKPRFPLNAYMFYSVSRRNDPALAGRKLADVNTLLGGEWLNMSDTAKKPFRDMAARDKLRHVEEMAEYDEQLRYYESCIACRAGNGALPPELLSMVNQVVRLRRKPSFAAREAFMAPLRASESSPFDSTHPDVVSHCSSREEVFDEDHEFFYVLTYIPDLFWCRLCPMECAGEFDRRHPRHTGRAKWKLIPEGRATEIDVSAARCQPVRSVAVKRTEDADHEEWDILDVNLRVARRTTPAAEGANRANPVAARAAASPP